MVGFCHGGNVLGDHDDIDDDGDEDDDDVDDADEADDADDNQADILLVGSQSRLRLTSHCFNCHPYWTGRHVHKSYHHNHHTHYRDDIHHHDIIIIIIQVNNWSVSLLVDNG